MFGGESPSREAADHPNGYPLERLTGATQASIEDLVLGALPWILKVKLSSGISALDGLRRSDAQLNIPSRVDRAARAFVQERILPAISRRRYTKCAANRRRCIILFRNFRHVNSRKSVDAELLFARGLALPMAKQEKNHARALAAFIFAFAAFFSGSLQAQTFAPTPGIAFTKPFGGADPLPQILTVAAVGTAFSFGISHPQPLRAAVGLRFRPHQCVATTRRTR